MLKKLLCMITLISLFMPVVMACGSGYKTFTQNEGYDHYSFEYPSGYKLTMNHAYSSVLSLNSVRFIKKLSDGSERNLGVNISNYNSLGVSARVNRILSVKGRELLEFSSDNISGVSCKLLSLKTENNGYEKIVFFDHNNRAWDIYMVTSGYSAKNLEDINLDFDHLLNTFKLLP